MKATFFSKRLKLNMRISRLVVIGALLGIIGWITQTAVLAGGRVEHHQLTSKILADAGQVANRELSVYVPKDYDSSGLSYPVVYLIHGGAGGTLRVFLGEGYPSFGGAMSEANAPVIADKLIESNQIRPLILVFLDMSRDGNARSLAYEEYLVQEVVSFVDTNYHTTPTRLARAIAGHSRGAADAFYTALDYPGTFSLVATYSSGFYRQVPNRNLLTDHDQDLFPLQFLIYVGERDEFNNLSLNRPLADMLKELGLPHTYTQDNSDHFDGVARWLEEESLMLLSEQLWAGVVVSAVSPQGKLATTWGASKTKN